ncbi:hypothetical protein Hanom_Chr05g00411421 [Helianthus anomalus]
MSKKYLLFGTCQPNGPPTICSFANVPWNSMDTTTMAMTTSKLNFKFSIF